MPVVVFSNGLSRRRISAILRSSGSLSFHIYVTGRLKNLIILSNGENVSPEMLENKFADEKVVKEIVVYGDKDRIVAEIFPDSEYAYAAGVSDITALDLYFAVNYPHVTDASQYLAAGVLAFVAEIRRRYLRLIPSLRSTRTT